MAAAFLESLTTAVFGSVSGHPLVTSFFMSTPSNLAVVCPIGKDGALRVPSSSISTYASCSSSHGKAWIVPFLFSTSRFSWGQFTFTTLGGPCAVYLFRKVFSFNFYKFSVQCAIAIAFFTYTCVLAKYVRTVTRGAGVG